MKNWKLIWSMALAALATGALVTGALADEGMVTLFKGQGSLIGEQGGKSAIVPFMKLRRGDRIDLGDGGRLQILYTATGRQETWTGAAVIEVGGNESQAKSAAAAPVVKTLPAAALHRLAQTPAVLTDIRNRTGMVMVRSGGLLEKIREIETTYSQMRQEAAKDDVTPELYFVSALYDLKLYRDMEEIMQEIVARQPDNEEAKALVENLRKAMENTGAAAVVQP